MSYDVVYCLQINTVCKNALVCALIFSFTKKYYMFTILGSNDRCDVKMYKTTI